MELANPIYPMRAVVRCKAKTHLLRLTATRYEAFLPLDEALFKDIATNLFKSDRGTDLYQGCRSKREAGAIEDRVAAELAETYVQIKLNQDNPMVQQLNSLL